MLFISTVRYKMPLHFISVQAM